METLCWPDGIVVCPHCGGDRKKFVRGGGRRGLKKNRSVLKFPNHGTMTYRCGNRRKRFSLKTGTVMERSRIPVGKWFLAIHRAATDCTG